MNIADVVMKSRNVESFTNLLPVSSVTSEHAKALAGQKGYMALYTVDEMRDMFHLTDDIMENLYYGCGFTLFYYWDKSKVVFPCNNLLMSNVGKDDKSAEIRDAVAHIKNKIASGNFNFILTALNDRMRIEYLKNLIDDGYDGAYDLFLNAYPLSDYGCSALGRDSVLKLRSIKTPEQAQATKRVLKSYPDTLTIYRGSGDESASLEETFSWTLDPAVAVFFATRFPSDRAKVYKATVKKDAVIEYFDGMEEEVIVFPDDVKEVEDFPFYGINWLNKVVEDGAIDGFWLYQRNADYDAVPFQIVSNLHGKSHAGRVLFMCMLLAFMKGLNLEDKEILIEAALYHDTGRCSDAEDNTHGAESAKMLQEAYPDTEPITLFLMEYHCRPDEEGYEFIEEHWTDKQDALRVKNLFDIFKDADGLDRVRLGNFELDMFQLRTEEARKLPQVAKITEEQLEI